MPLSDKMKLMLIADIHGSSISLESLLVRFREEAPDKLVILGDILYHGPRNPLPDGYNPKEVITLLNPLKDRIIAVRGNCDSEVDQMVLDFPMRGDYQQVFLDGKELFLSHGHIFNNALPSVLSPGSLYFQGHTHVPMIDLKGDVWHINPGSITLPKEGHPPTYGIFEKNTMFIKTLDGKIYMEEELS